MEASFWKPQSLPASGSNNDTRISRQEAGVRDVGRVCDVYLTEATIRTAGIRPKKPYYVEVTDKVTQKTWLIETMARSDEEASRNAGTQLAKMLGMSPRQFYGQERLRENRGRGRRFDMNPGSVVFEVADDNKPSNPDTQKEDKKPRVRQHDLFEEVEEASLSPQGLMGPCETALRSQAWVRANCKFAQANWLHGEWWIDDFGESMFADGGISDYNHEMLAMEAVLGVNLEDGPQQLEQRGEEIAEALAARPDFYASVLEDLDLTVEDLANGNYNEDDLTREAIGGLEASYALTPATILAVEVLDGNVDAATKMMTSNLDAREYMMMHKNWIRVQGSRFQLWNYDLDAKERILGFLEEEIPEDDIYEDATIEVEELSSGSLFSKSISELKQKRQNPEDLTGLRERMLDQSQIYYEQPQRDEYEDLEGLGGKS